MQLIDLAVRVMMSTVGRAALMKLPAEVLPGTAAGGLHPQGTSSQQEVLGEAQSRPGGSGGDL
jgi:hypothetical protein